MDRSRTQIHISADDPQNHAIMAAAGALNNRFRRRSSELIPDFIRKLYDFSNRKGPVNDEPRI
ncbi:hypothetical protein C9E91_07470 [Rhizobium sp. SEMIA4064]|nr:hypothetical protein C9E91_07470 [Rhizobium sp. SEMIA4064]